MFIVIGFMLGGICFGFLLRSKKLTWIYKIITAFIWLLLFLLGIEVGSNHRVIEGLTTLGVEAFVVTVACVLGSCIFAWGLWFLLYRKGE